MLKNDSLGKLGFWAGISWATVIFGVVLSMYYDNPWFLLISIIGVGGGVSIACNGRWK